MLDPHLPPVPGSYVGLCCFAPTVAVRMEGGAPISPLDHVAFMRCALSLAEKSPPQPTNFRVGALLVDEGANQILSTGYTLELPGNTHAEQCAFMKYAALHAVSEGGVGPILPPKAVLYTTMEPCHKRSTGNIPCVERILNIQSGGVPAIKTVYIGVKEPTTFVAANAGQSKLEQAGIVCIHVSGLENEILEVAEAGHRNQLEGSADTNTTPTP